MDLFNSHFITDIMILNIYIFCLSMINRINSKNNRSLVITFKKNEGKS